MTNRVSIPHVRALDGLRGVAVIGVMLFHSELLAGGYLGVDLFFVLSGFLITSLLLAEETRTHTIALGAFWARRARRLLPALGLMLAAVLAWSAVVADGLTQARVHSDALATVGYVANWRFILASRNYFDLFLTPTPLEHTWSLAIEEQFYVLWPLLVLGIVRWRRGRPIAGTVLVLALALGTASTVLMVSLYDGANTSRVYFGTDTRATALFAGIAVAAAIANRGHIRGRQGRIALEAAGLLSVVGLAMLWTSLGGDSPQLYRGGFLCAAIGGAFVIAAAVHPRPGPIARLLSFTPLCWAGLISYGLYLWHWPVDVVLDQDVTGLDGWPLFLLRFAVACAIAVVSYRFVEKPIRRGAGSTRLWAIVAPSAAALLLLGAFLLPGRAQDSYSAESLRPSPDDDFLLLGDSFAGRLAPGLQRAGGHFGIVVTPGCRIIHGALTFESEFAADCNWEKGWRLAVGLNNPDKVVVLDGIWDLFDVIPTGTGKVLSPGSQPWNALYTQQLDKLVDMLGGGGRRIILVTLPCSTPRDPECTEGDGPRALRRRTRRCGQPRDSLDGSSSSDQRLGCRPPSPDLPRRTLLGGSPRREASVRRGPSDAGRCRCGREVAPSDDRRDTWEERATVSPRGRRRDHPWNLLVEERCAPAAPSTSSREHPAIQCVSAGP